MSNIPRIASACILTLAASSLSHAQGGRVRVPSPPIATPAAAPGAPGATATPSAPSNLRAIGRSNKEIDLAWTASTEVGGTIASYQIQRCQGATCSILSSSTTGYSDTNLTPN